MKFVTKFSKDLKGLSTGKKLFVGAIAVVAVLSLLLVGMFPGAVYAKHIYIPTTNSFGEPNLEAVVGQSKNLEVKVYAPNGAGAYQLRVWHPFVAKENIVSYTIAEGDTVPKTITVPMIVEKRTGWYVNILQGSSNLANLGFDFDTPDPRAKLRAAPSVVDAGGRVVFSTAESTISGGRLTKYSLDFGDGSAPDVRSTPSTGIVHVYPSAGSFNARLTVTSDAGLTDGDTEYIVVNAVQQPTNTPVATQYPTSVGTSEGDDGSTGGTETQPGFEAVFAIAGLLCVAYWVQSRKGE